MNGEPAFDTLRARWNEPQHGELSGWRSPGVVVEGDFVGIQRFVLKPVPGAGGASRRLRGRSLLVVALTQLIAEQVCQILPDCRILYVTGGKFLAYAAECPDWRQRIENLQRRLDTWLLEVFYGDVAFHLVGAECSGSRLPREQLRHAMLISRSRPLASALAGPSGWNADTFHTSPPARASVCRGCHGIAGQLVEVLKDEFVCADCARDTWIGTRIAHTRRPVLAEATDGKLPFLDKQYTIRDGGKGSRLEVVHWSPKSADGDPALFDDLAQRSRGSRKYLGYLRMDADRVGDAFAALDDDPVRVQALSQLLHRFFCHRVQALIEEEFPSICPIYGGGDDLFVVGPWNDTMAFALRVASEFSDVTGGRLTLSAGLALSRPREHILTKSEAAERALNHEAKQQRDSISVLGTTVSWDLFRGLIETAEKLTEWNDSGQLPTAFLRSALELDVRARRAHRPDAQPVRFRPLLHYLIERNLKGPPREWARTLPKPESEWEWIGFLVRYAALAGQRDS